MRLKSYEHLTTTGWTDARLSIVTVLHIYIYIYALRHSVSLDNYVSGDQERKERLNIISKCLGNVKIYKYAKFDQNIPYGS